MRAGGRPFARYGQGGIEYSFLMGHPQHRWEFWNNRARSVLAFGSEEEARARLAHFAREAAHWEGLPIGKPNLSAHADQAAFGRFQLTCCGRLVHCDLAVEGRQYLELLHLREADDVWDWGEG